jgi:hypothetical protein
LTAFETLWKARRRLDNQDLNQIDYNILQNHGGDEYTRLDIGVLMEKLEEIMPEIEKYSLELEHPQGRNQCRDIRNIRPNQESLPSASYYILYTSKELRRGNKRRHRHIQNTAGTGGIALAEA